MPWNENIVLKKYKNEGLNDTELLTKSFDKYSVHYYKTTEDLKNMKQKNDYEIFAKTGHHWTLEAASKEINSIFQNVKNTTPDVEYPIINIKKTKDILYPTDKDIFELQNLFGGQLSQEYVTPVNQYVKKSNNSVFLFGTSFGWQLADALYQNEENHAFSKLIYQEYFAHVSKYDESGKDTLDYVPENVPSDLCIMKNIQNSDLLIMEQQDSAGILPTHLKFVDYVNDNMDRLYYNPGDNAISYTADAAGVTLDHFWGLEDWGRWTKGKKCAVQLFGKELAEAGGDLNIRLSAYSYGTDRCVEVLFNGKLADTIKMSQKKQDYVIQVPAALVNRQENVIEFCLDGDTFSPQDLGQSGDARDLGIGISNLSVDGGGSK